ncbi:TauD/TfdA family dioxygenase [uncultured Halomonas sp.]|uniref:TauD/TfdA family dioxygenase n=1 Tax=uncultured Halomonas sp. TaxID=173971 RepID=UPI00261CF0B6|nr:TauD/TfdA family dioxygenase [uncultured Halomonas sp.]
MDMFDCKVAVSGFDIGPRLLVEEKKQPSVNWHDVLHYLKGSAILQGCKGHDLRLLATESYMSGGLRARLVKIFPSLAALRDDFAEATGRSVHLIKYNSLGIGGMEPDEQAACFAIICLMLGDLLAAEKQTGKVVWDIKNRTVKSSGFSTFSEGQEEAIFHTDTAFYKTPVRYFGLYCRQSAKCGGGVNRFCNAHALRRVVENDENLSWISNELARKPVEFRVPDAFTESEGVEVLSAKVFGEKIPVRLRRDSIAKGMGLSKSGNVNNALAAVDAFLELALRPRNHIAMSLQEDGAVFVNNHEIIHSRSGFSDASRHLLRVWIKA